MELKLTVIVLLINQYCWNVNAAPNNSILSSKGTKSFLERIFVKFGNNGNESEYMTSEEFNKLLTSLYLGSVFVECAEDDQTCQKNALEIHGKGKKLSQNKQTYSESSKKRHRRDTVEDEHKKEVEDHKIHWQGHLSKCYNSGSLLETHQVNDTNKITKYDFLRLCPSIVEQIESRACVHTHIKEVEHLPHGNPTKAQVWGYGFLSITLISMLSLSVISMIPCLKKSYYHKIMAYLVALAVGTLSGDAMLHLIPHAFAEGVNSATNRQVSGDEQLKQHYSQVWRALFVLLGIYIFFLVENLMKLKGGGHGHSHGGKASGHSHVPAVESPTTDVLISDSSREELMDAAGGDETFDEKAEQKVETNRVNGQLELKPILALDKASVNGELDQEANFHINDPHHSQHHVEKEITKETKISTVAWMVIVGDGFHNFSDGLAVGAAFSASLSSGLSTAIAVFCHELPHELGDFALLINAGMTFKQAIVYNMVSAVLAFLGLAVGIGIGESELGRHFILSITAGLFLYVSLADMLPELTHQEIPKQSRCSTFILQHLGILSGMGIMLLISLFEHIM